MTRRSHSVRSSILMGFLVGSVVIACVSGCSTPPASSRDESPKLLLDDFDQSGEALHPSAQTEQTARDLTWTVAHAGNGLSELRSISLFDAKHGVAVGGKGSMITTSDGGGEWLRRRFSRSIGFWSAACTDARHGWLLGSSGAENELWATDGGGRWSRRWAGAADPEASIVFADDHHGWMTANGSVLATADGGATWHAQRPGDDDVTFRRLSFADALHGWAIAERHGSLAILSTSDGGRHWKTRLRTDKWKVFTDIVCTDAAHAWVAGQYVLLRTMDGGRTWAASGQSVYFTAVAFADRRHGWATGEDVATGAATILATGDGGRTWAQAWRAGDDAPGYWLSDLVAASRVSVLAVGSSGAGSGLVLVGRQP